PSKAAIAALCAVITRSDADDGFDSVTRAAATGLGEFRSDARDTVPVLVALLKRRKLSTHVRKVAATALGDVAAPGDAQAVAVLLQAARLDDGGLNASEN